MANSKQTTFNEVDGTASDLDTFCTKLIYHSQWKIARIFHAGSRMEVPIQNYVAKFYNVSTDKQDSDKMHYFVSTCAFPRSHRVSEEYTGNIVRILTEGTHAGYVRLVKEEDNTELLRSECRKVCEDETVHGPAVFQDAKINRAELATKKYDLGNAEFNKTLYELLPVTASDLVTAVHSPYWPEEAAEWITRTRASGFPTRSVIKRVISYGCDFVPVSHKLSVVNEWRFSFSKSELLIIESWKRAQNAVYGTLWLIRKKIDCKDICTYYLKTLMLWAYEEKQSDFWNENYLNYTLCEVLIYLMSCLKSKYCPNYFIPANNMMDHFIDTNLSHDINALWKCLNSPLNSPTPTYLQGVVRAISLLNATTYDLPAWVKRAIVIYDRINNEEDNFADLYQKQFAPDLMSVLHEEFSRIYRSLRTQQVREKCQELSVKRLCNFVAEYHLTCATDLCESNERDTLENCSLATVRSVENAYMLSFSQDKSESVHDRAEVGIDHTTSNNKSHINNTAAQKSCSSAKLKESRNTLMASRKIDITEHFLNQWGIRCYQEWPGESPTVNISWFIAKAYLANLYYVTKLEDTLTFKICDDVTTVYKLSYMNERFAERAFPIILSTELSCIYDKEIQKMIGFYSLCSFITSANSDRTVYLGVCPILFVLYIKLRIADNFKLDERKPFLQNFIDHLKHDCKCDPKVNSGMKILLLASFSKDKPLVESFNKNSDLKEI